MGSLNFGDWATNLVSVGAAFVATLVTGSSTGRWPN
jgi:hypothetical protein